MEVDWLALVEKFGFPVVVTVWLLWRTDRRLEKIAEGCTRMVSMLDVLLDVKCTKDDSDAKAALDRLKWRAKR